ncbi:MULTISPECIES: non-ribosomal peptide synthetase [unclassified Bacillus (in: firmicutes)]|uniref:non-ribosomal peptide synthetase n=1 Tax=unclassified Bacillus (in: firmicutes) TaxID=185979 RepID=UPI000BF35601|nr:MULTISPECIES: non-ribosomal peptide synthetase [unclassified Bacillus (in: firmicutes)]PEU19241.1 non-ribosomal peptide synthetase [Bacillus sp. AFS014408]PFW62155.1 non-ribosomal peptide synthetase [Bacillus sp. AFS075034]
MEKSNILKVYSFSPMQEGMLFHSFYKKSTNVYVEQLSLTIHGELNLELLENSFNRLIARHDIFRTVFLTEKVKKPRQVVLKERKSSITYVNVCELSVSEQENSISQFIELDKKRGFELSKDMPIRMAVLQKSSEEFHILISYHHIIMDGWSMSLMFKELFTTYKQLKRGTIVQQGPAYPYSNYIQWLEKQNKEEAMTFWRSYLADYESTVILPKQNSSQAPTYKEFDFSFNGSLTKKLMELAQSSKVTMSDVLRCVWGILLQRYCNKNDVVFGSVVSGRNSSIKGVTETLGLFINTIPVRIKNSYGQSFLQLLEETREGSSESFDYISLAEIQSNTQLNRETIDHVFSYQNFPGGLSVGNDEMDGELGFTIKDATGFGQTNYNFNIIFSPGNCLTGSISYNSAIFSERFIQNIPIHLENIVTTITDNPKVTIDNIDITPDAEKELMIRQYRETLLDFPREKTIQTLFEEQVECNPHQIALEYGGEKFTYHQLNQRANQLARILREKGIQPNDIVGVLIERSLEMIVGILAILKAGGAYLPIDPDYPEERIRYMLEDSQTRLLLTEDHLIEKLSDAWSNTLVDTINIKGESVYVGTGENLDVSNTSSDLAYVIYTSGSTGKPKGVMVEHQGIGNLKVYFENQLGITKQDRIIQFASFSFDASVWEIFMALLTGATAYLVPKEIINNYTQFEQFLNQNRITIATLPPTYAQQLNPERITTLRKLITAGSVTNFELVNRWYPHVEYINAYGPSETTICATTWTFCEAEQSYGSVPIGKPIANTHALILDQYSHVQPTGLVGELCIAGAGLARGYLNREELTKDKFIPHPLIPGERLYRTGDLARQCENGMLEFLGRIDEQVKIRGFRIEPGEISDQLLTHPSIKEAIVIDQKDEQGQAYLCAYVVANQEWNANELRAHLNKSLPDYMVPTFFVELNQIPLTMNGKIDRKALPKSTELLSSKEYVAPRNRIEEQLQEIWNNILSVDKISMLDNFFDLGGHSLKAMALVSQVHKEFNVQFSVREVFQYPTIEQMAKWLVEAERSLYTTIHQAEKRDSYPVSSAQKRMYITSQLDHAGISYNMPTILEVDGPLNINKVHAAYQALMDRHEPLRSFFRMEEENLAQLIHEELELPFHYIEVTEDTLREKVASFIQPFDLNHGPLIRVSVFKIEDERHVLCIDMHHIISDGISMNTLMQEFIQLYKGETNLPVLKLQYKDYSVWQQGSVQNENLARQEQYWMERLAGEIPVLELPTDFARSSVKDFAGDHYAFTLGEEVTKSLKKLSEEKGTTLYMTLLAAYNVLLNRYTGQEDIIVGSAIAGRPHTELEAMVGLFVNTLALRNEPRGDQRFETFLEEVKNNVLKAYENADYPLEDIIEKLNLERDLSRNPLFDTMFTLQNMEIGEWSLPQVAIRPFNFDNHVSKFDLTMIAMESKNTIKFILEFRTKLFTMETIERLAKHFEQLIVEITTYPEKTLSELEMLSEKEIQQLLDNGKGKVSDYPRDKTIHALFEEQAALHPDSIALEYDGEMLTYDELNKRANQLAHTLRAQGIDTESIVGIMVEPSLEMVIGQLAILKAGGAYLPIDPEYPEERIAYMLENSQTRLLLTQQHLTDKVLTAIHNNSINMIDIEDEALYKGIANNVNMSFTSSNLAYVIYTSGSTGKPKGVLVEHQSLVNLCYWHNRKFEVTKDDRASKFAGFSFDASVWEIFPYLIIGARICLIPGTIRLDVNELNRYFIQKGITISFLPTQYAEHFMKFKNNSLRILHTGGDRLSRMEHTSYKVVNNYGPTENTVVATSGVVTKEDRTLSIGKPIDNVTGYVVDKHNQLQPIGLPGELCLSGEGLVRSYLNQSELTAEKFVDNPFVKGEKMYRTGDLVRWLPNGQLDYIGRIDGQVKIRGFRIELGEISNQLLELSYIQDAVVLDHRDENGQAYLCAYIVAEQEYTVHKIRTHLAKTLPNYMIPTHFIELDQLPLTPNGKVDYKALPELSGIQTVVEYVEPRNEIEETLVQLWQEILCLPKIGVKENFFEMGGHSLRATMLVSRMHKVFNVQFSLREVFQHPTIEQMAQWIESAEKNLYTAILPVENREYYPVTSAQKRMYIISQLDETGVSNNLPTILEMHGPLNGGLVEAAFQALIDRHEPLRTSFEMVEGGELVQIIHDELKLPFEYVELVEERVKEKIASFIQPFDLEKAPLIRVMVIKIAEERHVVCLDLHHIISDGVSMNILLQEFVQFFEANTEFSALKVQYKDYAVWQQEWINTEDFACQKQFWHEQFAGELPLLELPTDYARPNTPLSIGANFSFELNEEMSKKLNQLAADHGATIFMTLFAAYNVLLARYSGQEDIIVGTPVAGRQHADLEPMTGMFVNTLALRNRPKMDHSFSTFLREVIANTIKAFEHQQYPLEELIDELGLKRNLTRNPLFDTMFLFQNMEFSEVRLKDITIKPYELENKWSKFDLTLGVVEHEGKYLFDLEYSTALFNQATIKRMANHLLAVISSIIEDPNKEISSLNMITEQDLEIINKFNDTTTDYPKDCTIVELFEKQVEMTPNELALVAGSVRLTYSELNTKANMLARVIRGKGIKPDEVVGLLMDRSVDVIIGMMATLKAGGAYLPIDQNYPKERIKYLLQNSNVKLLLTREELIKKVEFEGKILNIQDHNLFVGEAENLPSLNESNDLAYIIYTSGSTGRPKGVMIEQYSIINLACWFNHAYDLKTNRNVMWMTNISFDVTAEETIVTLLNGATIFIPEYEITLDKDKLSTYIQENEINLAQFVPYTLNELLVGTKKQESLNIVISGGDKLDPTLANSITAQGYQLYNHYGPTEATVDSTSFKCLSMIEDVYLGRPNDNERIYLLDSYGNLQPIGLPGEICIAGDGLARGYVNNPKLTTEKFVYSKSLINERIYRTGDLARMTPEGNLEYLGRIDEQVKIMGVRIELGEIQEQLLQHPDVHEAIVIVRKDETIHPYICAYIVEEQETNQDDYRTYLAQKLPGHMVPRFIMKLNEMPVNYNGKIDRKALPAPDVTVTETEYVPPRNKMEQDIASVWREILEVEKVGVMDNFFELGGNSIKAVRVITKMSLHFEVNINQLFTHQTIDSLAKNVVYKGDILKKKIEQAKSLAESIQANNLEDDSKDKQYDKYMDTYDKYLNLKMKFNINTYSNILLAGVTGYLGSHLLRNLLEDTTSNVYVLVRGKDKLEAENRLLAKLTYYFDSEFYKRYKHRIFMVKGDLTQDKLGLTGPKYIALANKIDCVVNAAANVKHYGHYQEFYEINVLGTERLIDFALLNHPKDFHSISTTSVANGNMNFKEGYLFTEDDFGISNKVDNHYIQTKIESENMIIEARSRGLNTNIYRVGNLISNSETGIFQENIQDNAFYKIIKSLVSLGVVPKDTVKSLDFSFVDYVSKAVTRLIFQKELINEIYHVFNHNFISLMDLKGFLKENEIFLSSMSQSEFLEYIHEKYQDDELGEFAENLLFHLQASEQTHTAEVIIASGRTQFILKELGFEWPTVNSTHVIKLLDHCMKVGFIKVLATELK